MKCPKCQSEFSKEAAIQNSAECPTCGEYLPFLMRVKLIWHHLKMTWTEDLSAAEKRMAKLDQRWGKPVVVCLCGSTRFRAEYARAFYDEEHAGRIALSVPCYKDDSCCKTEANWARLDALHRHKIELADEILVLNVGGYIGQSTAAEITFATECGKRVRYLEPIPAN